MLEVFQAKTILQKQYIIFLVIELCLLHLDLDLVYLLEDAVYEVQGVPERG